MIFNLLIIDIFIKNKAHYFLSDRTQNTCFTQEALDKDELVALLKEIYVLSANAIIDH